MKTNFEALEKEPFDLNQLAFQKISSIDNRRMISFREITRVCGVVFHLSRKQTFLLLKTMEEKGLIKIYPYKGIKILKNRE
jgi:hypothetical protein